MARKQDRLDRKKMDTRRAEAEVQGTEQTELLNLINRQENKASNNILAFGSEGDSDNRDFNKFDKIQTNTESIARMFENDFYPDQEFKTELHQFDQGAEGMRLKDMDILANPSFDKETFIGPMPTMRDHSSNLLGQKESSLIDADKKNRFNNQDYQFIAPDVAYSALKKQASQTDADKGRKQQTEYLNMMGLNMSRGNKKDMFNFYANTNGNKFTAKTNFKNASLHANNRRDLFNRIGEYNKGVQYRKAEYEQFATRNALKNNKALLKAEKKTYKEEYKKGNKDAFNASGQRYNELKAEQKQLLKQEHFAYNAAKTYSAYGTAMKSFTWANGKTWGADKIGDRLTNGLVGSANDFNQDLNTERQLLKNFLKENGAETSLFGDGIRNINSFIRQEDGTYRRTDITDFLGENKSKIEYGFGDINKADGSIKKLTKTELDAFNTLKAENRLALKNRFAGATPSLNSFSLKATGKRLSRQFNQTDAGAGLATMKSQSGYVKNALNIGKTTSKFAKNTLGHSFNGLAKLTGKFGHGKVSGVFGNIGNHFLHPQNIFRKLNSRFRIPGLSHAFKIIDASNAIKALIKNAIAKLLSPLTALKAWVWTAIGLPLCIILMCGFGVCAACTMICFPTPWEYDDEENRVFIEKCINDMLSTQQSYLAELEAQYDQTCRVCDAQGRKLHPHHTAYFYGYKGDDLDVIDYVKETPDTTNAHMPTVTLTDSRLYHYDITQLYRAIISMTTVYTENDEDAGKVSAYCCYLLDEILHHSQHSDENGTIKIIVNDSGLCNLMRSQGKSYKAKAATTFSDSRSAITNGVASYAFEWDDATHTQLWWWSEDENFEDAQEIYEMTDEEWDELGLPIPGSIAGSDTGPAIDYMTIKEVEDKLREQNYVDCRIEAVKVALQECGKHIYGLRNDNSYLPFQLDCSDFVSGVLLTARVPGAKDMTCLGIAQESGRSNSSYKRIAWADIRPGDILVKNLEEGKAVDGKVKSANHTVMYVGEIPGFGKHCVVECSVRSRKKSGLAYAKVNGVAVSGFDTFSQFKMEYNYAYVINPYWKAEQEAAKETEEGH